MDESSGASNEKPKKHCFLDFSFQIQNNLLKLEIEIEIRAADLQDFLNVVFCN